MTLPIICRKCSRLLRDDRTLTLDKTAVRLIVTCTKCGQTYHYDYDSKTWSWEILKDEELAGCASGHRGIHGEQDLARALR